MKPLILILLFALTYASTIAQIGKPNMQEGKQGRYEENPIYLFFESYIQDVIGSLPEEKSNSIQKMNLQDVFKTKAKNWKSVIKETLHLSETIDIAILDLWYKNKEHFKDSKGKENPVWFSQVFTDKYMEENSKVDVWVDGALEAAKKRIKIAQKKKENKSQ